MNGLFVTIGIVVVVLILISVKQINQYERGVKYSFGKFKKIMMPGWKVVIPIFQSFDKVNCVHKFTHKKYIGR